MKDYRKWQEVSSGFRDKGKSKSFTKDFTDEHGCHGSDWSLLIVLIRVIRKIREIRVKACL